MKVSGLMRLLIGGDFYSKKYIVAHLKTRTRRERLKSALYFNVRRFESVLNEKKKEKKRVTVIVGLFS